MKKIAIFLVAATIAYFYQQSVVRSRAEEMPRNEQVIRISASNFEFKPSKIAVKKGVPVTLELINADGHHGFRVSAFELRADITPGVVRKVHFVPDKIGKFTFLC